jgi:predicted dehydrogenase
LAGVRNLGVGLGDVVLVMGVGLIGQLSAQLLALQGARVICIDVNKDRLSLAARHGAELTWVLGEPGLSEAVATLTQGRGVDAILVAAATQSSEPLEMAADLARDRARVVMVGKTGTEFPYAAFMKKELSLMVSRSYGPGRYDDDFEMGGVKYPVGWVRWTETENLAESLRLMSPSLPRHLTVSPLITHSFVIDQAEDAYELVTEGKEPSLGVVLTYPDRPAAQPAALLSNNAPAKGRCALGVIGAGSFARTVLLPELARQSNVDLVALATTRGHTADHGAQTFNFLRSTTDAAEILADPSINAVLVATRHADHAQWVAACLAAGKSVLVEKPLALTMDQINQVRTARHTAHAFFQVGFNRRFAPFAVTMQSELSRHPGPKVISLRVNAGALPPESWVNADAEGGGRILGELCHFIDLARFLAGSPIVKVDAQAALLPQGTSDDVNVTLSFLDGSLASILYTSMGDSAFSKERIECFVGGTVLAMDNFLNLSITGNGKSRVIKARAGQDKGHSAELFAFAQAVANGTGAPVNEEELLETSQATLLVLDSLRLGHAVTLE